jgi:hypothetical protein
VCCCACLTEQEKHRYGSLITLLLLLSNWRPSRVLGASMLRVRRDGVVTIAWRGTFSMRDGKCCLR